MKKQILTVIVTDTTTNRSYSERWVYAPSVIIEEINTSRSRIIKAHNLRPCDCVVTHMIEEE